MITASSLRRSLGVGHHPQAWTNSLLTQFDLALQGAPQDQQAKNNLEVLLIQAQRYAFMNPFVSCSTSRAVANSFATVNDTPGYVLTITGPHQAGLDFNAVRNTFSLYADGLDYLKEFGIPRQVTLPFRIIEVHKVTVSSGSTKVWP